MFTKGGLKVRLYAAAGIAIASLIALVIRPGDPVFASSLTLALGYLFGAGDGANAAIKSGKVKAPPLSPLDDDK